MRYPRRRAASAGAVLAPLLSLVLAGCTADGPSTSPSPTAAPTPPPTATPAPAPASGTCHQLTYAQAVAPTTTDDPVDCTGRHTAETYAVGRLSTELDGHLLAVDSPRVQAQVRRTCPDRLGRFVGGTAEDLRLSMVRAVWFTPTVAASDDGADWFRCDVIVVAGDERLAAVTGSLRGVLGAGGARRDTVAMCGTAEPGTNGFRRVTCSSEHRWRALRTVDLGRSYPGTAAARDAGQSPCRKAGQDVAADALDYRWAYEWPTRAQWDAGQTYGICWAPD